MDRGVWASGYGRHLHAGRCSGAQVERRLLDCRGWRCALQCRAPRYSESGLARAARCREKRTSPIGWELAVSQLIAGHRVVHAGVYDVTDFLPIHPGGNILFSVAGTDATDFFTELHKDGILEEVRASLSRGSRARRCQAESRDMMSKPCTLCPVCAFGPGRRGL